MLLFDEEDIRLAVRYEGTSAEEGVIPIENDETLLFKCSSIMADVSGCRIQ